jgi:nuclear pore complex protein Nup133
VLGVYTDSLDARSEAMDESFRNKLLENMKWEDNKLRRYIEKARLDLWFDSTLECAKKTVAYAYRERTTANVNMNGNSGMKSP